METKQKIISVASTTIVSNAYQEIIEKLKYQLSFNIEDNSEITLLEKTGLVFIDEEFSNYLAFACFDEKYFEFTDDYNHQIVFNNGVATKFNYTLLHELGHIIVKHFNIPLTNQSGPHCLEFAIIVYCLQWRLFKSQHGLNSCFFKTYDIHEDKAYPNLTINPCQFDALIKCIEWNTLQELSNESKRIAKRIRQKSIKKENEK